MCRRPTRSPVLKRTSGLFRLTIGAVGKDQRSEMATLVERYLALGHDVGRGLKIDGPSLAVVDAPKGLDGAARQAREADLLAKAVDHADSIILLDERGKDMGSVMLADMIRDRRDQGTGGMAFLIGGADGFPSDIDRRLGGKPIRKIAFGKATWPHKLVRVMLAEQIYRALTIMSGHPYHRP